MARVRHGRERHRNKWVILDRWGEYCLGESPYLRVPQQQCCVAVFHAANTPSWKYQRVKGCNILLCRNTRKKVAQMFPIDLHYWRHYLRYQTPAPKPRRTGWSDVHDRLRNIPESPPISTRKREEIKLGAYSCTCCFHGSTHLFYYPEIDHVPVLADLRNQEIWKRTRATSVERQRHGRSTSGKVKRSAQEN